MKSLPKRQIAVGVLVGLFALGWIWRSNQKASGLSQLDRYLRQYQALGVPRCSDHKMDAFEDQWANIPGIYREMIGEALLDYCGAILPSSQYRIIDTYSGKTLAVASRGGGVEIR